MYIKTILEAKGPEMITVSPGDGVRTVAQLFKREHIGFALVENEAGTLVGTVSERDIVQAMAHHGDVTGMSVADVMTTNVVTCDLEDSIDTVRELMTEKRTRHVLVMNGGQPEGIVSIGDLIKHSLSECRVDTSMLREYINGQGYQ